jgi:hypothetical protein
LLAVLDRLRGVPLAAGDHIATEVDHQLPSVDRNWIGKRVAEAVSPRQRCGSTTL